jgi:mycothiol synthase
MRLTTSDRLEPGVVREVGDLLQRAAAELGRRPLSDHLWVELARGGADDFVATVGRGDGPDGGDGADGADRAVTGYAQATAGNGRWQVEVVLDPAVHRDLAPPTAALLGATLDAIAARGGGPVSWWVFAPRAAHEQVARQLGLAPGGTLHQMRVPLPLSVGSDLTVRAFVPGRDEAAWVAVNNRAFAGHEEQGGWTSDDVLDRERESWFDAAGFLLHERDGRLAGFCWTKVHPAQPGPEGDPELGEIYVIAVDPDFHGLGLGRELTVAGLQHLASVGVEVGMLYVDADNVPAMRLYESLGFTVHATDRSFVGDVPASSTPPTLPTDQRGAIAT